MENVIKIKDQFYILADSSIADAYFHVLNHSETFAIFDRHGDIRPLGFENQGLFFQETRFLSRFRLKINGKSPLLLSSNIKEDNDFLAVDLMNPDFEDERSGFVPRGTVHIMRTISLWEGRYFERMQISNFGLKPVHLTVSLEFEADYADIFELRGVRRVKRGNFLAADMNADAVTLGYEGLDHIFRRTCIQFDPAPVKIENQTAYLDISLEPQVVKKVESIVTCIIEGQSLEPVTCEAAFAINRKNYEECRKYNCRIETSNSQFNDWLNQSSADLQMLLTQTGQGLYPFAGIPWFSTIFGRDGIITALETLWFYPEIARGVLGYLAYTQAKEFVPEQDAEPGKILHEQRRGEMARLREIPFGQYYGSIDATPLFVILAGAYYERTADMEFLQKIWPHVEAALVWMEKYGDSDGDGFIEYKAHADGGLRNQGWKDSEDCIFHRDGRLAEPPIALCEVQGYQYEAKRRAADMMTALGDPQRAAEWRLSAEAFKEKFHKAFWCEETGVYAIALDRDKKPCGILNSNAGHCLFSGIAQPGAAEKIVRELLQERFFSGWGIRTIAAGEMRYNPMSYHNGSIWPHDNALIAAGFARYGYKKEAAQIMGALFDASIFVELHRLPELFCGFERRQGEGPTLYPVACDPQAWSACAVFLFLEACLGLSIRRAENKILFNNPYLPEFLPEVAIKNLQIGPSRLDLFLQRRGEADVSLDVKRKQGTVDVVLTK